MGRNEKIIMILVAVIVVLAVVLGVMFMQSADAKKRADLEIISNDTLNEGDSLSLQLNDENKNAISNEWINVKINDSNGKLAVNKTVKTNSKGKAKLDLDLESGNYAVAVGYAGNENYTCDNATQELAINDVHTQTLSTSSSNSYPKYNPAIGSYRTVESQNELALIETSSGQKYVLAGDGYYTYAGHDSMGYIKLGDFVGKY